MVYFVHEVRKSWDEGTRTSIRRHFFHILNIHAEAFKGWDDILGEINILVWDSRGRCCRRILWLWINCLPWINAVGAAAIFYLVNLGVNVNKTYLSIPNTPGKDHWLCILAISFSATSLLMGLWCCSEECGNASQYYPSMYHTLGFSNATTGACWFNDFFFIVHLHVRMALHIEILYCP